MLALVRCGRPAEALEAYQFAREVLAEELGTEPGAGLQELHLQILAGDSTLAMPESAALAGNGRRWCRGSCQLRWPGLSAEERN